MNLKDKIWEVPEHHGQWEGTTNLEGRSSKTLVEGWLGVRGLQGEEGGEVTSEEEEEVGEDLSL